MLAYIEEKITNKVISYEIINILMNLVFWKS
jgi:hypothetical protein